LKRIKDRIEGQMGFVVKVSLASESLN